MLFHAKKYFILVSALIGLIPSICVMAECIGKKNIQSPGLEIGLGFAIVPIFLIFTMCSNIRCLSIFATILLIFETIAWVICLIFVVWAATLAHSFADTPYVKQDNTVNPAMNLGLALIWTAVCIIISKIILNIVTCSQLGKLRKEQTLQ